MFTVNRWPARCPFGHDLGPGKASTSWDMELKKHWLICGACNRRTQLCLGVEGAQWQVLRDGEWFTFDG